MSLFKIYLIPHGDEIIDLPDEESMEINRHLKKIAEKDESEVLVIISPHGLTLGKGMAVINTESFTASIKLINKKLNYTASNQRDLTEKIIREFPELCNEVRFSTYSGELSVFPLDFGTAIPLYFFKQRHMVYIGQPRIDDRDMLIRFGKKLFEIADSYSKKVSIILSADQAHTHSAKGPYGYSEKAGQYEEIILDALYSGNMKPIKEMDGQIIKEAKPDSFWNMLILEGFLDASGRKMTVDYRYVALYFGMILAHSN